MSSQGDDAAYGRRIADAVHEKVSGLPILLLVGMPALFSVIVPWLFGAVAAMGWKWLPLHVVFLTFITIYVSIPILFAASLGFHLSLGARALFVVANILAVLGLARVRFDVSDVAGWLAVVAASALLALTVRGWRRLRMNPLTYKPRPRGVLFVGVAAIWVLAVGWFLAGRVAVHTADYPLILTDARETLESLKAGLRAVNKSATTARLSRAAFTAGFGGNAIPSAPTRVGWADSALMSSRGALASIERDHLQSSHRKAIAFTRTLVKFVDSTGVKPQELVSLGPETSSHREVRRLDVIEARTTEVYAELYNAVQKEIARLFREVRLVGAILFTLACVLVTAAWVAASRERRRPDEPAYAFAFGILVIFALPMLTPIEQERINVENPLTPFTMGNWFIPDLIMHVDDAHLPQGNLVGPQPTRADTTFENVPADHVVILQATVDTTDYEQRFRELQSRLQQLDTAFQRRLTKVDTAVGQVRSRLGRLTPGSR